METKRTSIVLNTRNVELLNSYHAYFPKGMQLNLTLLINELLEVELQKKLAEVEQTT